MSKEEVVEILNNLQQQGFIKITNYENLTISLRAKIEKDIQVGINDFIKNWSQLWHGKKADGYYLAQPPKENLSRMMVFMRENPEFSPEVIMEATKRYIEEKEASGYQYCKKSNKFIADTDGSVMYAYCVAVMNGDNNNSNERVGGI
tara:strand:- start:364 stop:804 length:441 start_codon:yes stop_codon:yes gene_type:complete